MAVMWIPFKAFERRSLQGRSLIIRSEDARLRFLSLSPNHVHFPLAMLTEQLHVQCVEPFNNFGLELDTLFVFK